LKETEQWMGKNGYGKVDQFKGTVKFSPWISIPQWIPVVDEALCNGCGRCVPACMNEALTIDGGTAKVNTERCEGCGACYFVCPTNAISRTA
jgi:ferredoxin